MIKSLKIHLMATIQIRIEEKLKKSVQKILKELGLDMSSAIKLYLNQIVIRKGLPFRVLTENGFTLEEEVEILRASAEAKKGINISKPLKDIDEIIEYLESDDN